MDEFEQAGTASVWLLFVEGGIQACVFPGGRDDAEVQRQLSEECEAAGVDRDGAEFVGSFAVEGREHAENIVRGIIRSAQGA